MVGNLTRETASRLQRFLGPNKGRGVFLRMRQEAISIDCIARRVPAHRWSCLCIVYIFPSFRMGQTYCIHHNRHMYSHP
jgi:hypothetical protein